MIDLEVTGVMVDALSVAHTRFQQTFAGIPVWQGEAIVHLNPDGSLFRVTDHLIRGLEVDLRTQISPREAIQWAELEEQAASDDAAPPRADLCVFPRAGDAVLAWRVQLTRLDGSPTPALPVYFIDARSGEVLLHYDNLQTVQGTGTSLYSGAVPVETYLKSGSYYLEDVGLKLGTFDMAGSTNLTHRLIDRNNIWDSSSQQAGVDAHFGARMTYQYYLSLGRTGIDGGGGPGYYMAASGTTRLFSSRVHYGSGFNNAFWDGARANYGDGDGVSFSPLVAVDIVGHEMAHGVTQFSANLSYYSESGALNESWSDVFGALVEFYTRGTAGNWLIGEQVFTPAQPGDALRSLADPHSVRNRGFTANDDPDHYSERYIGSEDNGGVHINSGISNKAFYLLAQGGTHHLGGSMTGIGREAAARIWYSALTGYMTTGTTFAGARTATLNAAEARYGRASAEYAAVGQAWTLCGVN